MADTTTHKCIHCKVRVATRHQIKKKLTLCDPCRNVVKAENLWNQLGLKKPKTYESGLMPLDKQERATKYENLLASGKTFQEIAELWGITSAQLTGAIHRLRRQGYKLPYGRELSRQARDYTPPAPKKRGRPVGNNGNEHGGGKYGVSRCKAGPDGKKCEPCRIRSRASNNENRRRNKERKELYG